MELSSQQGKKEFIYNAKVALRRLLNSINLRISGFEGVYWAEHRRTRKDSPTKMVFRVALGGATRFGVLQKVSLTGRHG